MVFLHWLYALCILHTIFNSLFIDYFNCKLLEYIFLHFAILLFLISLWAGLNNPLLFSCDVPLTTAVISVNRNHGGQTDDCWHLLSPPHFRGGWRWCGKKSTDLCVILSSIHCCCDFGILLQQFKWVIVYEGVVKMFAKSYLSP